MLDFATYQKQALTTAVYPGRGEGNFTYPALGLAGETGEVCEKLKKAIRDDGGKVSEERRSLSTMTPSKSNRTAAGVAMSAQVPAAVDLAGFLARGQLG